MVRTATKTVPDTVLRFQAFEDQWDNEAPLVGASRGHKYNYIHLPVQHPLLIVNLMDMTQRLGATWGSLQRDRPGESSIQSLAYPVILKATYTFPRFRHCPL